MEQSSSWETNSHSVSQEITPLYRTRKFITVFTRAGHWSSWATCIKCFFFSSSSYFSAYLHECSKQMSFAVAVSWVVTPCSDVLSQFKRPDLNLHRHENAKSRKFLFSSSFRKQQKEA